jgi:hypothetical protein
LVQATLGETSGLQGEQPELWRIECPFCGEKGNFASAFHVEKKKPKSTKRLNFDVYRCWNCTGYVHVLWSAREHSFGRGTYDMRVMPRPINSKPEPSPNWPEGVNRFWIQAHHSLAHENWDAANVMARSAVQSVVREKQGKGKDLKAQINDLVTKGILHPLMK